MKDTYPPILDIDHGHGDGITNEGADIGFEVGAGSGGISTEET